MLISKRHGFIYIHISKVAGQSVKNALIPYAAANYQIALSYVVPFRWQLKLNTQMQKRLGIKLPPAPFNDHIRVQKLIDIIGLTEFERYFSFTIVRNPWDRLLSQYKYTISNRRHGNHSVVKNLSGFSDFIEWHYNANQVNLQSEYVYDRDGKCRLDFIGRFENIEEDFNIACEKIGIQSKLSKLNVSKGADYHEYYTNRTRDLVADIYRRDIYNFGYSF